MKCLFTATSDNELLLSQSIEFRFLILFLRKTERMESPEGGDRTSVWTSHENLENSNKLTGNPDNTSQLAAEYWFPLWIRGIRG